MRSIAQCPSKLALDTLDVGASLASLASPVPRVAAASSVAADAASAFDRWCYPALGWPRSEDTSLASPISFDGTSSLVSPTSETAPSHCSLDSAAALADEESRADVGCGIDGCSSVRSGEEWPDEIDAADWRAPSDGTFEGAFDLTFDAVRWDPASGQNYVGFMTSGPAVLRAVRRGAHTRGQDECVPGAGCSPAALLADGRLR